MKWKIVPLTSAFTTSRCLFTISSVCKIWAPAKGEHKIATPALIWVPWLSVYCPSHHIVHSDSLPTLLCVSWRKVTCINISVLLSQTLDFKKMCLFYDIVNITGISLSRYCKINKLLLQSFLVKLCQVIKDSSTVWIELQDHLQYNSRFIHPL